jgi:hypothetical protein
VTKAREEFEEQVMRAKEAYEMFSKERAIFFEEKLRWEQQGLPTARVGLFPWTNLFIFFAVLSRMTTAPLNDIK